jgi:hypothetical protein
MDGIKLNPPDGLRLMSKSVFANSLGPQYCPRAAPLRSSCFAAVWLHRTRDAVRLIYGATDVHCWNGVCGGG